MFLYLVRDFSNMFFFLKHDLKIKRKVVVVFFLLPKQPPFQVDTIWLYEKAILLKESLPAFKSRQ